jgi:predicted tellurium resistance membrane protein TerC
MINDFDNLLIISAVIRKYGYQIKTIFSYIVLSLTISRTLYTVTIQFFADIPGLRVIIGMILLCVAIRLACTTQRDDGARSIPSISIGRMILILLATDFSICLDSVMITAELSTNLLFIMVGIFLSVSTVFLFLDLFSEIFVKSSLIQIIASGLIAYISILSMVKDPITKSPIVFIEDFFEIQINHWINIFALDMALLVVFIGLMNRLKNRN